MAAPGQQAHQQPLAIFLPGLQMHPVPGVGQGLLVGAVPLVDGSEAIQGVDHLAAQLLPVEEQPFLEWRSVGQGKPFEEQAPHQAHRLVQPLAHRGNRGD